MTIELEHKPGTNERDIEDNERDFRKDTLARVFGQEKFDKMFTDAKDFFTRGFKERRLKFETAEDREE